MKLLIAVLVTTLGACAGADFRVPVVATSALIACDVSQTVNVSDGGRYDRIDPMTNRPLVEKNPLLGERPSPAALVAIGLVDLGVNYAVYRSSWPGWAKATWFSVVGAVETYAVASNARVAGACGVVGVPSLERVDH